MRPHADQLPDISMYVDLIGQFIKGSIAAADFEGQFIQQMKAERRTLGEPIYPILQELFEDADAHVEQPELRTEPEDLDDEQLLRCARRARASLRDIGIV